MEIKINCHLGEGKKEAKTSLFEGINITHQFINYENIADFQKQYYEVTKGNGGFVIGIPQSFWESKETKEDVAVFFLLIHFNNEQGDFNFVVVKNATVFITSKGQTIDKVIID